MKQPCRSDCENRTPYCRTSCDKWSVCEAQRNEQYKQRLLIRQVNDCVSDGVYRVQRAQHTRPKRGMV